MTQIITAPVTPLNMGEDGRRFFDLLAEVLRPYGQFRVERVALIGRALAVTPRKGDKPHLIQFAQVEGKTTLVVSVPSWCDWDPPHHYKPTRLLQQWGVTPEEIRDLVAYAKECVADHKAA